MRDDSASQEVAPAPTTECGGSRHTAPHSQPEPVKEGTTPEEQQLASHSWPAGFYYQDMAGDTQGPYFVQQLQQMWQQWPQAFRADMQLWYTDGADISGMVQLQDIVGSGCRDPSYQQQFTDAGQQVQPARNVVSSQSTSSFREYADAVLAGEFSSPEFANCVANISNRACVRMDGLGKV